MTRRSLIAAVAATFVVASVLAEHSTARGWSLVARAANRQGITRRLADLGTVPIVERLIFVPIHGVPTWARMYGPVAHARQTVLLVSRLHRPASQRRQRDSLDRIGVPGGSSAHARAGSIAGD
jgi:hypothetical protein